MPSNTQELLGVIKKSLGDLSNSMERTEKVLWDKTVSNIQNLEYSNQGNLIQNTHNTKVLGDVKHDIDKIFRSPGYKRSVAKFGKSYDVVARVQNDWFSSMVDDFKPSGAIATARNTSVKQMIDSLVGGGVHQAVTQKAGDFLLQGMQSGASIRQVNDGLRELMVGNKKIPGRLTAYSGQIAVDSINQYSAAYNEQVIEDLGFEWYQYVGRVKDTTRPFCAAAVKQRYFHKSEFGKAAQGELRIGKVSTAGMYPDMNADKLKITRGGYNCNHQFRGVATKNVPMNLRASIGYTKKPIPGGTGKSDAELRKLRAKYKGKIGTPGENVNTKLIVDKIEAEMQLRGILGGKQPVVKPDFKELDPTKSVHFKKTASENKKILTKQFEADKASIKNGKFKSLAPSSFYGDTNVEYAALTKKYKNDFKDYYVNGIRVYSKDVPPIYQFIRTDESVLSGTWNRELKQIHPPKPIMELLGKNMQNGFPNTGTVKGIPSIVLGDDTNKNGGGSFNAGSNIVTVHPTAARWRRSNIYPQKVVTHEFGHATSYNLGLEYYDRVEVEATRWDGSKYNYRTSSRYSVPNDLLRNHADKGFNIIKETKGGQSSLNKFDKMVGVKNTKWTRKPLEKERDNFRFEMGKMVKKLGYNEFDADEMIGVAKDMMSAATKGRYGGGHRKDYFLDASQLSKTEAKGWLSYQLPQVNNNNYSEYVAHSAAYVFDGGNPVIDKLYPGLGENFIDFWADVLETYMK